MIELFFKPIDGLPSSAIHEQTTLGNKTGSWRSLRPVYESKLAPCRQGCPAGENISGYFNLIRQGLLSEAWALIRQDNPLPAVCGRVCYHPCEEHCNRGQFDQPISIHALERFVGDHGLSQLPKPMATGPTRGKVAVVGSGPAGLSCAYHLAMLGYAITIYESSSSVGGMLALGIPEYRLPRDVLRAEIASIERLGVKIVTGAKVGTDLPLDRLFEENCQAVFLAIGAHRPVAPNVTGMEMAGVTDAISLLRRVNSGDAVSVGNRVAVFGGGNVAIDAARCARRLGAREVSVFYRRSREEMPAHASEVEAAEAEGILFNCLVAPVRVIGAERATGIECLRTSLGDLDPSGRRQPVPIAGSEFTIEVDTIVMATGQTPDSADLARQGLRLNPDGTLEIDPTTMATSRPGVFAGGDAVSGPARVVDAIAAGKKAAHSIHRHITSQPISVGEDGHKTVSFSDLNLDYFRPTPRVQASQLPADQRIRGFDEVTLPLSEEEVRSEVERCFSCGLCNGCDNCLVYCPDLAISRQADIYSINYDYCKGCGICVTECPRSAVRVEEEAR